MFRITALALVVCLATLASAAPEWKLWDNNLDLTTALGIAFVDENTGYIAGGANGAGDEIFKTTDGAKTFDLCQAKFGSDLLLLDMAASGKTAIVSGAIGEVYTINSGETFQPSIGGGLSQNCMVMGKKGTSVSYGCVGTYNFQKVNGVAVTKNGGITFETINASALVTPGRYGSFPTDDTWYIAAGTFPAPPPPPPSSSSAPRRPRTSVFQNAEGRFTNNRTRAEVERSMVADGYVAQIVKTTDGGKTWKSQFLHEGGFYMNGIDCYNSEHCCAAAEGSGSATPEASIYCTEDGGKNWNRTFNMPSVPGKVDYSLTRVNFVSEKVVWAVGGVLKSIAPSAWFIKSEDGGKTWTPLDKEFLGWYALGLDMVSEDIGYAAMDNLVTQHSAVFKYTSAPAPAPGPSPPSPPPPGPSPPPPPGPSPPPSPGKGHYEDPNTTGSCQPDEEKVQITGLSGSFCSPSCSASSPCPTDVPAGTTARPQCVLEKSGTTQPTNCALICNPNAEAGGCPDKATCKAIQTTGICTYDS